MCGRARCTLNPAQVAKACGLKDGDASSIPTLQLDRYRPSYNVSPGAYLPVLVAARSEAGEGPEGKKEAPVIHCMKWGLVPSFTNKAEKPDHYRMFNARSESIKEKASFRRLIQSKRCLVAVEGFFEWKKDGSRKQPYYIHFSDDRPLVFAALYDSWGNSEGDILHTFTILTTRSSSSFEWLHDRMPVILGNKDSIDLWLNNSMSKFETVLGSYEGADLVWYPVTPSMGKPSFNGPECIKELKTAGGKPLSKFFSKKIDGKCQPEPEVHKSSEGFPQTESGEHLGEKCSKSDAFTQLKKETAETDGCGTKRGVQETAINSQTTAENSDSWVFSGPSKKKGGSANSVSGRQASLLSYFGRS